MENILYIPVLLFAVVFLYKSRKWREEDEADRIKFKEWADKEIKDEHIQ